MVILDLILPDCAATVSDFENIEFMPIAGNPEPWQSTVNRTTYRVGQHIE